MKGAAGLCLVLAMSLAACGYDATFTDCTIRCSASNVCPEGLSCSISEGLCRSGSPTSTCASLFGDGGTSDTNDGPFGDTTSNLVGWWKLDEGSGTMTADSSGNGNTGSLQNAPTWTIGASGNALAFNGSNQFVSLADSTILQVGGTNVLTLAAWVKRGTTTATGGIVQKNTAAIPNTGFTLSIGVTPCAPNEIKATKFGVTDICLGSVPADTSWHHIAIVFSGAGVVAYIDGSAAATRTDNQNFLPSADAPTIGVDLRNSDYFNGSIDDVRIYRRALSATDVMSLVN